MERRRTLGTYRAAVVATVIGLATFGATPPASASDVTADDVADYLNFGERVYKWNRSPTLQLVEGTSRDQFAILREVMYDINGALPPGMSIKFGNPLPLPERTWLITEDWYLDNVDRHTLVVAFVPTREWPRFMCRDSGGFTTVDVPKVGSAVAVSIRVLSLWIPNTHPGKFAGRWNTS